MVVWAGAGQGQHTAAGTACSDEASTRQSELVSAQVTLHLNEPNSSLPLVPATESVWRRVFHCGKG